MALVVIEPTVFLKRTTVGPGEVVMVYDAEAKLIRAIQDQPSDVATATKFVMVKGTREEIDAEIAKLALKPAADVDVEPVEG
jgi:hypothetical protein